MLAAGCWRVAEGRCHNAGPVGNGTGEQREGWRSRAVLPCQGLEGAVRLEVALLIFTFAVWVEVFSCKRCQILLSSGFPKVIRNRINTQFPCFANYGELLQVNFLVRCAARCLGLRIRCCTTITTPRLIGINPPWVGYKSRGAEFGVWWSTLLVYLDQILHASAFVWSAGGNHVRWEPGQRAFASVLAAFHGAVRRCPGAGAFLPVGSTGVTC